MAGRQGRFQRPGEAVSAAEIQYPTPWHEVVMLDPEGRRGLWMRRLSADALELRAGREGDDCWAVVTGDAARGVEDCLNVVSWMFHDELIDSPWRFVRLWQFLSEFKPSDPHRPYVDDRHRASVEAIIATPTPATTPEAP